MLTSAVAEGFCKEMNVDTTRLNTKFLAALNILIQLLLHRSTIPAMQCLENLDYYEILSVSLLREERCRETLQFSFRETQWKTWCAKTKQGKIQQKAFSCWEWLGCQGVYLAVMDGSCSFPSFTTCEVVWSLKGLHLRARMNDACSLFLVAAVGVQTGAVADGKTGIFPLSKPIQAMPGQKCGCAGLV